MKSLFYLWTAVALALLGYGFYQGMYVAPTEATMGPVQRIFYWHVPLNIVGEITPYVNMIASIAFLALRRKNIAAALKADAIALASAEVTVLFVGLGLLSGILWGKPAWGIWWTFDARTTTFLLLWLLYVSYLLVRRYSSGMQAYTIAAVLSIFAGVDVPIVFMSIRWWRTQHPSPVLTGEGSMAPAMWVAMGWNAAAWLMWAVALMWARYAILRREQKRNQAEALRAMEA
ncbi:MAG: cytochrome c biogenesis protein CcsA [Acidobacteria bacterium]|nr:cytochrome c biogenesis protein CcsA [Acidobacteriota bacterium]